MRRAILAVLPWYRSDEVEPRHAATADAVAQAAVAVRRTDRVIASYRAAGRRLSRL